MVTSLRAYFHYIQALEANVPLLLEETELARLKGIQESPPPFFTFNWRRPGKRKKAVNA
jgi:hypothetical protein